MLQRILCSFLAVFCFVSGVSPKASASWADIVNDYSIVPLTDFVVDVLQGVDKVGDAMTDIMGENFRNILDFWTGLFSSDTSEDDYISGLPYVAVSSNGSFVIYPEWDYTPNENFFHLTSSWCSRGNFSFELYCFKEFGRGMFVFDSLPFFLDIGTYQLVVNPVYVGSNVTFDPYYSVTTNYTGSIAHGLYDKPVVFSVSNSKDYMLTLHSDSYYFSGFNYSLLLLGGAYIEVIFSPSVSYVPDTISRPSSFMQLVNNYNDVDNSTNYFIGMVDADGKVTDVFDPALYDEETLVFTEPVTGAQYQTSGWIFDYNTRTYRLSLEPGTFLIGEADIDRIDLTYGDDVLTISYYADGALIQTDTYAYVTATKKDPSICQHSYTSEITTAATCTAPGVRTYTCSLCGDTYTEEIPQLDHVYTYETVTPPTCIDPGERKGVCSVCGAEVVEDLESLGHDWQPSSSTQTTYALPEDAACPDCGSTSFDSVLSQGSGTYDCTCSSCGTEWIEQAVITYGQTTYTCSRCGETYVESQDADSGLFAAIGDFIADGIGWIVDKLKQLIDSLSGINDIFSDFIEDIKSKSGQYPAFLGAVIAVLPEDFMTVIWFSIIAGIVLAVWKLWFR